MSCDPTWVQVQTPAMLTVETDTAGNAVVTGELVTITAAAGRQRRVLGQLAPRLEFELEPATSYQVIVEVSRHGGEGSATIRSSVSGSGYQPGPCVLAVDANHVVARQITAVSTV